MRLELTRLEGRDNPSGPEPLLPPGIDPPPPPPAEEAPMPRPVAPDQTGYEVPPDER